MDQEQSFSYLPPEILLDILSRIPIKAVFTCKCVCKSWLDLLETAEFARSHFSKSAPGLLIHRSPCTKKGIFEIVEFEESLEVERHEHHYKTALELDVARTFDAYDGSGTYLEGSANGLIFLLNTSKQSTSHYVCNPITREYIKLPEVPEGIHQRPATVRYGFGVSRLSNQYKIVRILLYHVHDPDTDSFFVFNNSVQQVYTLGTKSWRSTNTLSGVVLLDYSISETAVLLNGNLHWLAGYLMGSRCISCFDLENEVFTKFCLPIVELGVGGYGLTMGVLRDRLCLCGNSSESEVAICLMNDYGDMEKSWNKVYVISKSPSFPRQIGDFVYALKAFGDGDVLMASEDFCFFFGYSNKTKTTALIDMFNVDSTAHVEAILYTPSFILLKDYETENAKVF